MLNIIPSAELLRQDTNLITNPTYFYSAYCSQKRLHFSIRLLTWRPTIPVKTGGASRCRVAVASAYLRDRTDVSIQLDRFACYTHHDAVHLCTRCMQKQNYGLPGSDGASLFSKAPFDAFKTVNVSLPSSFPPLFFRVWSSMIVNQKYPPRRSTCHANEGVLAQ